MMIELDGDKIIEHVYDEGDDPPIEYTYEEEFIVVGRPLLACLCKVFRNKRILRSTSTPAMCTVVDG